MAAYTEALGDEICKLTEESSIGLRRICLQLRQPYSTVTDWICKNLHGFADKYARAKQLQRDRLAEEMLEIADDDSYDRPGDSIRRAKLRIDVRKWLLTNLAAEELENKEDENSPVNIIIKRSSPLPQTSMENIPGPEPQYDQRGAMPAIQNKTSLSPDAILKDKSVHQDQENIAESSPKNSSFIRHSDGEGGEPVPAIQDQISPDAIIKDKRESESQENIVENIALRSVSSALIYPGSSLKNTVKPAPGEFVEFAPGRSGRTYPNGGQPGLYR